MNKTQLFKRTLSASLSSAALFCFSCLSGAAQPALASNFALHDGEHVTFYGDSITEQRQYTEDVEVYLLTRFPQWKVSFHNAGVGGDKVSGGWAGPIDLRLRRDVFAFHPDVITVMLGMNDMYYRADDPGIFSTYSAGYRHIVESMQHDLPHARITLIEPSPYDDVSRDPMPGGGYNAALVHYSQFIAQLAHERQTQVADLNTPVNALIKAVMQQSPDLATQLVPDRVHPQQAGHWIMAESLLKAWNAPAAVSSVVINAGGKGGAEAQNAEVTDLHQVVDVKHAKAVITWTELDRSLPLPLAPAALDPVMALAIKASDLLTAIDQETLQAHGLPTGNYDLSIDDRKIGVFTSDDLTVGVNLAAVETPMLDQARLVAYDTERKNDIEAAWFKIINTSTIAESSPTAAALAKALPAAEDRQRLDAQPRPHHFQLMLEATPASSPAH